MGTLVHIRARGSAATDVERAIEAAFEAIDLTERLMSFHCGASELSRLNRSAHQHPLEIGETLSQLNGHGIATRSCRIPSG